MTAGVTRRTFRGHSWPPSCSAGSSPVGSSGLGGFPCWDGAGTSPVQGFASKAMWRATVCANGPSADQQGWGLFITDTSSDGKFRVRLVSADHRQDDVGDFVEASLTAPTVDVTSQTGPRPRGRR